MKYSEERFKAEKGAKIGAKLMRETDGGSLYYIAYSLRRYPTEHPKKLLDIPKNKINQIIFLIFL